MRLHRGQSLCASVSSLVLLDHTWNMPSFTFRYHPLGEVLTIQRNHRKIKCLASIKKVDNEAKTMKEIFKNCHINGSRNKTKG